MKHIFPALKMRWDANAALKQLGGTLRLADDAQSARPNTSVHGRLVEPMDTFGSDLERWSIEFRLHGRGSQPQDSVDWFEAMRGAYHRARLAISAAAFIVTTLEPSDSEEVEDGTYDSRISFTCYFQRNSKLPVSGAE